MDTIAEINGQTDQIDHAVASHAPLVLRSLVSDWPLVQAARSSRVELRDYLLQFDGQALYHAMVAPPEVKGKLGYRDESQRFFNFKRMKGYLSDIFDIFDSLDELDEKPTFYVGSTPVDEQLPGLRENNALDMVPQWVVPNIWMSSRVTVATHNDAAENIACVVSGRRRFTLFPPDQEPNLYMGPSDVTPAGRPISQVDLETPDFERFPRFREALEHAQVAELTPGDAIYIPFGWWHNVKSQDSCNILINYWW